MKYSIAIEEWVQVDYITILHQIVGALWHFNKTACNSQEDVDVFVSTLFINKFHTVKEWDALVFGFIDENVVHLFPMRI